MKEIKSEKDINDFLEETRALHDGCIIDVQYKHSGIKRIDNCLHFHPDETKLTLKIFAPSIFDAIVEIEFENLLRWQINSQNDYLYAACVNIEPGYIVWSSEIYTSSERLEDSSYVIARSMKWRIAD